MSNTLPLTLAEKISFVYNDKPRLGVVEALKAGKDGKQNAVILTTEGYRTFKVERMQGLVRA